MVGDLFKILGIYLREQVRRIAVTIILLLAGTVATGLALGMGFSALYLWLQLELGTFAALAILGGGFTVTALILFAAAFRFGTGRRRRARSSLASQLPVADHAREVAAEFRRRNPRQSALVTILVTIVLGWIVGRRMKR
jgi:hypothetical protein